MPRICTICAHKKRAAIEKVVLAGEGLRKIAGRFGTSVTALHRHKSDHLTPSLVKANGAAQAAHGDDLLGKVRELEADARRIMSKAEQAEDLRTAVMAIRELARLIDLLGKLRGEIQNAPTTINIQVLAPVILKALEGYPEARLAVAERLSEMAPSEKSS